MKESNFDDYIKSSALYDIIHSPYGANIAPHNDNIRSNYSCESISCKFKFDGERNQNEYVVNGTFDFYDRKGNKSMAYETGFCGGWCELHDYGMFSSSLTNTSDELIMTTSLIVFRKKNILGQEKDFNELTDNFFVGIEFGFPITMEYKEYFIKLSSNTKLLHFSELCGNYELFNIPNNWKFEDGLLNLGYPNTFMTDDGLEAIEYDEISDIMNIKKKNRHK